MDLLCAFCICLCVLCKGGKKHVTFLAGVKLKRFFSFFFHRPFHTIVLSEVLGELGILKLKVFAPPLVLSGGTFLNVFAAVLNQIQSPPQFHPLGHVLSTGVPSYNFPKNINFCERTSDFFPISGRQLPGQ